MKRPIATNGTSAEQRGAVVVTIADFAAPTPAAESGERVKRLSWLRRKALMRSWRNPGDRDRGALTPR